MSSHSCTNCIRAHRTLCMACSMRCAIGSSRAAVLVSIKFFSACLYVLFCPAARSHSAVSFVWSHMMRVLCPSPSVCRVG
eukprot:14355058-Alexandrium_andersonii.AAC.1